MECSGDDGDGSDDDDGIDIVCNSADGKELQ